MLEKSRRSLEDELEQSQPESEPGDFDELERVRRRTDDFLAKGEAALERALANPISLSAVRQPGAQ